METITWSQLAFHVLNILVIFLICRLLVYKPIMKFLLARQAKVDAMLGAADKTNAEAEKKRREYEDKLEASLEEVSRMMNESTAMAHARASEIVQDAQHEADAIMQRSKREIEEERKHAMHSMREEVTDMAVQLAGKVIKREVTAEDNKKLIDEFFEKVG